MQINRINFSVSPNGNGTYRYGYYEDPIFKSREIKSFSFDPNDISGRLTPEEETKYFTYYNWQKYKLSKMTKKKGGVKRGGLEMIEQIRESEGGLFKANEPLVTTMVKKTYKNGDYEEFVSEGNHALLRAVRGHNPFFGCKFSTYACNSIGRSLYKLISENFSRKREKINDFALDILSLEDYRDFEQSRKGLEIADELRKLTFTNLLNENEARVITQRYLLGEARPRTLERVGIEMHLTKERVRQIEAKAMKKLRSCLENRRVV